MPGFAGFDSADFPGTAEMAWLKANTNLTWCGYYRGPVPSHRDTGWMGQMNALRNAGWGLAPLYVGQQIRGLGSHNVTGAQGTTDGQDAVTLLNAEGFVAGTCIYLDFEDATSSLPRLEPTTLPHGSMRLRRAVLCRRVLLARFRRGRPQLALKRASMGIQGQYDECASVSRHQLSDLHPAGSGYPGASIWQLGQNCQLSLPAGLQSPLVDLDSSVVTDPGYRDRARTDFVRRALKPSPWSGRNLQSDTGAGTVRDGAARVSLFAGGMPRWRNQPRSVP